MADQGITTVGCCVLCLETYKDPRILPTCGHTFCLNCIKQHGKNEKTELECPMCRTMVRIPAGGLEEFPKNYSLSDILESGAFIGTEEPVRVSPAQVIKLESYTCTQHTENELQLYCIECSKTICLECVDAEHSSHKLFTISKIAADARIQLQSDMEKMKGKLSLTRQERNKIEEAKKKLLCLFAERELDIKKEYEQIKSYLEEHKKALDLELMTLKTNLMKQLEIEKQDVEAEELSLTSFTTHVTEMIDGKNKRANFKVVESLKDLNSRSWELKQMKIKEPATCRMTSVTFRPTDVLNRSFFANDQQNMIGTIDVKINSSNDDCARHWKLPSFGARRNLRSPVFEASKSSASGHSHDISSGHSYTNKYRDDFEKLDRNQCKDMPPLEASGVAGKKAAKDDDKKDDDDNHCIICMDDITDKKELPCKHKFCRECIDECFSRGQPKCPSCGKVFGTLRGDQPKGTMTSRENSWQHLAGYNDCGAIEINYSFKNGIQGDNHPKPGQPYRGTHRTAFLPANKEGHEVLRLLKRAFDAELVFTIGRSNTTGQENVVIWNDVHHKTSPNGQYGYPDPTYLKRVKEELAAKGIQ